MLELNVTDVQPNAAVNLQAPAGGAPQAARVESTKVADGVWYLAGTPDPNSQLVEFKDFLVIVESSVTEGRALANIAEAHRARARASRSTTTSIRITTRITRPGCGRSSPRGRPSSRTR